eukprot:COSAG05_NODE_1107_length_5864_cov_7.682741_8_plen_73_part_00
MVPSGTCERRRGRLPISLVWTRSLRTLRETPVGSGQARPAFARALLLVLGLRSAEQHPESTGSERPGPEVLK